jgi:glycosyltransferase involved in cell wall biosynthesis
MKSNSMLVLADVWMVIPAYNEANVIASVISHASGIFPNIIVIDDCSIDRTADAAYQAGATVLRHCINLGQGAALQTGIDYALQMNAQVIVTYDADGQHRVEDALALANVILNGNADIAVGSRFLGIDAVRMPRIRSALLRAAAIFTRLTTGVRVTDAHNGLRAIAAEAARRLMITQNRMAHASEIISQVGDLKLNYTELPIQVLYTNYSMAKMQKLSNSFHIIFDLLLGRISK